jgi:hypothetical protein
MMLAVPSFVKGLVAAMSFLARGRVHIVDVMMASLVAGLTMFGLSAFGNPPRIDVTNFVYTVGVLLLVGFTNWLLVRSMRRQIAS